MLIGVRTPLIKPGDDLPKTILRATKRVGGLRDGDVLVIASKVVAVAQGRIVKLSRIKVSRSARKLSKESELDPTLVELVLRESDDIVSVSKHAILTVVRGVPFVNAGIDLSNAPKGHAILLPSRPNEVAEELRESISNKGKKIGVIIADSTVRPLRLGTVGQAIGIAGLTSVIDLRGKKDLFGNPLRVTRRCVADQIATSAELLMGEAGEKSPVVIVRGLKDILGKPTLEPKVKPRDCVYFKVFYQKDQ